jgi:hypothetical protein
MEFLAGALLVVVVWLLLRKPSPPPNTQVITLAGAAALDRLLRDRVLTTVLEELARDTNASPEQLGEAVRRDLLALVPSGNVVLSECVLMSRYVVSRYRVVSLDLAHSLVLGKEDGSFPDAPMREYVDEALKRLVDEDDEENGVPFVPKGGAELARSVLERLILRYEKKLPPAERRDGWIEKKRERLLSTINASPFDHDLRRSAR